MTGIDWESYAGQTGGLEQHCRCCSLYPLQTFLVAQGVAQDALNFRSWALTREQRRRAWGGPAGVRDREDRAVRRILAEHEKAQENWG